MVEIKHKQMSRKSVRLNSESTNDKENSKSQSRITEFLNVRKRGRDSSIIESSKISEFSSENFIRPKGTPVKIKKKILLNAEKSFTPSANITETIKNIGIITPSPSLDFVNKDKDSEVLEVLETKTSVTANENSFVTEHISSLHVHVSTETQLSSTDENLTAFVPAYKRFAHLKNEQGIRNQRPKIYSESKDVVLIEKSKLESISKTETEIKRPKLKHAHVPWLPLNEKWSFYEKLIFNVDSLCVLSAGRSQPCIFHKIQKTLENVIGKQVPLEKMEILKTVWPEAYEYRGTSVILQGKRIDSIALTVPELIDAESSAALLNYRKEEVKSRIQKHVLEAHEKFLIDELKDVNVDVNETIRQIPKQWHPKFNQDRVTDITRTSLLGTITNCKNTIIDTNTPKLIKEIANYDAQTKEHKQELNEKNTSVDEQSVSLAPKKQLSLLERIRAKEQKLNLEKVFGIDVEIAKERAILEQMERFTQSVLFSFSSMKKTSLFLTDLTNKLIQSSRIPLSSIEVYERLKLLEKAAPDWIKIVDEFDKNSIVNSESLSVSTAPKHVKILDKHRTLMDILECIKKMKTRT